MFHYYGPCREHSAQHNHVANQKECMAELTDQSENSHYHVFLSSDITSTIMLCKREHPVLLHNPDF